MTHSGHADYRELLREHFLRRCRVNPKYSLRAFAQDLGLSSARLSHVLSRRYGLSSEAGEKIALQLGLSRSETEHFCALIEAQHSRSTSARKSARKRLEGATLRYQSVNADAFRLIADWYHFPLIELTLTEGFRPEAGWIADQLGIARGEAAAALTRLKRLGYLVADSATGRLRPSGRYFANPDGNSSEAIRSAHRGLLERAKIALDVQPPEVRDFSHLSVAIRDEDVPYVKAKLLDLRNALDRELSRKKGRRHVYSLNIQFYCAQKDFPRNVPKLRSEKKEQP